MKKEENYITLLGEDNSEELAEVLFTFENHGENYVLLTLVEQLKEMDSLDDEYNIIAYKYEETENGGIGNLIEIGDKDQGEWDMIEEMLTTFEETKFEEGK